MWLKLTDFQGNPVLLNMRMAVTVSEHRPKAYPVINSLVRMTSEEDSYAVQETLPKIYQMLEEL